MFLAWSVTKVTKHVKQKKKDKIAAQQAEQIQPYNQDQQYLPAERQSAQQVRQPQQTLTSTQFQQSASTEYQRPQYAMNQFQRSQSPAQQRPDQDGFPWHQETTASTPRGGGRPVLALLQPAAPAISSSSTSWRR